jgi:glutamyl-tRNA synthetase
MREQARAEKKQFKYPRPAELPSKADADRARQDGKPVVARFKMPDQDITVSDSVLGDVLLRKEELEDFVIRKADGYPTYHFACVVDDAAMKISHVIRGSEHLNNTPKHIALQRALGYDTPVYVHVPIISNMSGSKMSKRDKDKAIAKGEPPPEIDVHDFRLAGYMPEALINFIALLGWSAGDDREKFTIDELIDAFEIERIGKTSSKFDREKLLAFSTDTAAAADADRLLEAFEDYLALNDSAMRQAGGGELRRVLEVCAGFRTFADVVAKAGFIFVPDEAIQYDPKAVKKVLEKGDGEGYEMLAKLRPALQDCQDWTSEVLDDLLKSKAEQCGVGFGKVAQPLRVALSGTTISPSITDTLLLLGKDRTMTRIGRALSKVGS